ncbi:MAG: gloB [Verrucomicrobiales bacterium]|nr:gloB [Verrucomicrobiales bacterium]
MSTANIPLEDNFADVVAKAQRGLKLTDDVVAQRAGVSVAELKSYKDGNFNESVARKLAPALDLAADALVELGKKAWYPPTHQVDGLAAFNTTYEDMTVNSYVVFDPKTKEAAVFDTGATAKPMLEFVAQNGLKVQLILLTHTHVDHIADLKGLKAATGAPTYVGEKEQFAEAEAFAAGKMFHVGNLKIESRQTSGHARGGITFVVSGLGRRVAVVGDAMFACSMGGGMISYEEALRTNRKEIFSLPDDTIVCPGHGPLTTVGEQKKHNPFYPEFQK